MNRRENTHNNNFHGNTQPRYGKPPKQPAEVRQEKLVVVAVENFCPCHQTVTLRCRDRNHWVFIFVKSVPDVNFGDMVLAPRGKDGLFTDGDFYLYYNRKLMYRLQCDDFPSGLMEEVIDNSAAQMYPDEE